MKTKDLAIRIFRTHLEKDRLASTYLMTGQQTFDRESLAMEWACALQCQKKKYFKPCECNTCQRVKNQSHPDVKWIQDHESRSIKIETIRELIQWASLKPYEGKRKVCILSEVSRLTLEASNALLKTLEEPPSRTVFCLLADSKEHLLETIQSRSFEIRLGPAQEEDDFDLERARQEFEGIPWEDVFEPYQSIPREELKGKLDSLMKYLQLRVKDPSQQHSDKEMAVWTDAMDRVYETREAIEANGNQKLALSRLAMQLRKTLSQKRVRA